MSDATTYDGPRDTARTYRLWDRCGRACAWIGRHDLGLMAAIVVVGLGVYGFLRLGHYVSAHETHELDSEILLAMRAPGDVSDPLGPGWVEEIGRDLTALGGIAVLSMFTIAAFLYTLMRREKLTALILAGSVGGGMAVSLLLKHLYDRPRPDLVTHGSIVYTKSFPSGHSMLSAVVYLTLAAILVRVQPNVKLKTYVMTLAVLLTVLVGVSRVYLGVHWPTDVLAGWAAGAAWAALAWYVTRRVHAKKGVHPELDGVPQDATATVD